MGVAQTAEELARRFGEDPQRAYLAGLLHDCAKYMSPGEMLAFAAENGFIPDEYQQWEPSFMHAQLGAILAQNAYEVNNPAVLRAIALHQSGEPGMTELDMLVNLADLIEPGRGYPGVERLRLLAETDLHVALREGLVRVMAHVRERGMPLYPPIMDTYHWLCCITMNEEADT